MTLLLRRLFWILPVLILALFLLLSVITNTWLESSGGRLLLQREFAKTLGRPVRLEGAYRLKLFPRLKITGTEFEIGLSDGPGVLGSAKEYSATIELLPFVKGEVRIASIELLGGFVDLNQVAQQVADGGPVNNSPIELPQLGSLLINDFHISLEQEGSTILIRQLELKEFQPGRAAILDIDAGLLNELTEVAHLRLQSELTLAPGSWSAQLSVLDLQLEIGRQELAGLTGEWRWNQPASHLAGQLAWVQPPHSGGLQLDLVMNPHLSGSLNAHYGNNELLASSNLEVDFSLLQGGIDLQKVNMEVAGQSLSGVGCLWLTEVLELHLFMQAGELDLDKIYAMLALQESGNDEFPFKLAVLLQAEKVWLAGAEAIDVNLEIGQPPDCNLAGMSSP